MRRHPEYPCPTCNGFARILVDDGKQVACARCGTVLPPLPFAPGSGGGRMPNPTPIRQGMKANIGGKDFWTGGLIRYEARDGSEVSTWYEWVLLAPDGDARYLEFDEGRWTLTEPFDPGGDAALSAIFGAGVGASAHPGGQHAT